jgi:hypothetical protein
MQQVLACSCGRGSAAVLLHPVVCSGSRGRLPCMCSDASDASYRNIFNHALWSLQLFGDPQLLKAYISGSATKEQAITASHGTVRATECFIPGDRQGNPTSCHGQ